MFTFSIKQLLRQPGKVILFFLLMAASTALVVTGAVLTIENSRRIQIVEDTYTTVGYVEQALVEVERTVIPNPCTGTDTIYNNQYGEYLYPEVLDFPGADYILPPEKRPYYWTYLPGLLHGEESYRYNLDCQCHIVEFTPLEPVGEDGGPAEAEVTRVLYSYIGEQVRRNKSENSGDHTLEVGEHITVCQCFGSTRYPLEVGEKYVSILYAESYCQTHEIYEYVSYQRPHSYQQDRQGNFLAKEGVFPDEVDWGYDSPYYCQIAHVTGPDFYEEGNPGYRYMQWAAMRETHPYMFTTVGTNGLELLPRWHKGDMVLRSGREISPEEFETGALVCMLPRKMADINQLAVGGKIKLSMLCTINRDLSSRGGWPPNEMSTLDADGNFYQPFWEAEYEIVGTFDLYGNSYEREIMEDTLIIPAKSVQASDEDCMTWVGPMANGTTSFQIPNGSIQAFDEALRRQVPEAERLNITYDDRGYSEIRSSLDNSRSMARLLLMAGVMAALSILALLLYFFVVREKKRTAVERSLGMTKAQ